MLHGWAWLPGRYAPPQPSLAYPLIVWSETGLSSGLKMCKNDKNIEKIAVSRFKNVQNHPTLANMKFNDLNAMFCNSVLHTLIQ